MKKHLNASSYTTSRDTTFMVPINKLLGKNLDVKIFAYDMEGRTREFPISSAGTSRINARLPLEVSE